MKMRGKCGSQRINSNLNRSKYSREFVDPYEVLESGDDYGVFYRFTLKKDSTLKIGIAVTGLGMWTSAFLYKNDISENNLISNMASPSELPLPFQYQLTASKGDVLIFHITSVDLSVTNDAEITLLSINNYNIREFDRL